MKKGIIAIILICLTLMFGISCGQKEVENKYKITIVDGNGSGNYSDGEIVNATAILGEKDIFNGWLDENGEVISTDNPYTFIVRKDRTITASITKYLEPVLEYATVTVQNGTGSGKYEVGSKVSVVADQNNSEFLGWEVNGKIVSMDLTYTFTLYKDTTITAKFLTVVDLSSYTKTLYKKSGEDFVIANFTDIQLHDGEDPSIAIEVIRQVVEKTNPDLIVFLGDMINDDRTNKSVVNYKLIYDAFDSYGIPWTFVFGNHDYEDYSAGYESAKTTTSDDLINEALKYENCIFTTGPSSIQGKSNYIINIVDESTNEIVKSLIMLDSRLSGINSTNTAFYKQAIYYNKSINNGVIPESIVYSHIAIPAYGDAYTYSKANEYKDCTGLINRNPCDLAAGDKNFFETCKQLGTKFCICGHDHENAYYVDYQGVTLCYTMKSSNGDKFDNYAAIGGSAFYINDEIKFEYVKANIPELIEAPITLIPQTLPNWANVGAKLVFDFTLEEKTDSSTISFALFGTNMNRIGADEKTKTGSWNRLTGYIRIDTDTLTSNYGTITEKEGKYHFELQLSTCPFNNGNEATNGTETLCLIYFDKVERPFTMSGMDIIFE